MQSIQDKKFWERVYRVMEREQLCSEHAAICWMAARRKKKCKSKQAKVV